MVTCIYFALFCFSNLKEKRRTEKDVTVVFNWAGQINTCLGKSFLFGFRYYSFQFALREGYGIWPRGYKTFFIFNSVEHEI